MAGFSVPESRWDVDIVSNLSQAYYVHYLYLQNSTIFITCQYAFRPRDRGNPKRSKERRRECRTARWTKITRPSVHNIHQALKSSYRYKWGK